MDANTALLAVLAEERIRRAQVEQRLWAAETELQTLRDELARLKLPPEPVESAPTV